MPRLRRLVANFPAVRKAMGLNCELVVAGRHNIHTHLYTTLRLGSGALQLGIWRLVGSRIETALCTPAPPRNLRSSSFQDRYNRNLAGGGRWYVAVGTRGKWGYVIVAVSGGSR